MFSKYDYITSTFPQELRHGTLERALQPQFLVEFVLAKNDRKGNVWTGKINPNVPQDFSHIPSLPECLEEATVYKEFGA